MSDKYSKDISQPQTRKETSRQSFSFRVLVYPSQFLRNVAGMLGKRLAQAWLRS